MYLWEEVPSILPKDPYVSSKISLLAFQSYLVAIINQSSAAKQNIVHVIKPSTIDSLFKLKVGTERIAVQQNLQKVISRFFTMYNRLESLMQICNLKKCFAKIVF